jgi:TM2 domain-containing membrane protein YozV
METTEISPKSRLAVVLFAWFLGCFGVHRFYLGEIGLGLLMLITLGGLGIWALVDFIMAVAGVMKDKDGKLIKNWE